jgi:uncharacterized Ntn-hydrolase superfamily protein
VTFSVVARDAATGDLGCAVQSKFPAVGAVVIHARAGVGAVATQALSNVGYGPRGLALLEAGASPSQALVALTSADSLADRRQAGIVDVAGRSASHTGTGCSPWAGHIARDDFACQGNMLVSAATVEAMARVMVDRLDLPFPERLVTSLAMGQGAGGDARGQQSAALLVVRPGGGYGEGSDRLVDLRVDDHQRPIEELGRLLAVHRVHFDRPADADLTPLTGPLVAELAFRLSPLAATATPPAPDEVWDLLEAWAGRENLEERMIRRGHIDREMLRILRERTPAPPAPVQAAPP